MICTQCQELISDYIDGLLELGEQVKIERHLADCEPCRAVRDDLLQIVHFSHQLPERAPSNSLWARIQSDIANEQPKGFFSRGAARWEQLRNRHFNLSIPQLVASAAALAIIISVTVMIGRRDSFQGQTNPDIQQLEQQINELSDSVEQRKGGWNSELRAAFERNMYYINQSLVECKH